MEEGEAVSVMPEEFTPEPESATESGVGELPMVRVQAAARAPAAVGSKRTLAVQLADAARVDPQLVEEMAKSPELAPEMTEALMVTELEVLLVTVMICDALLEPRLTLPKFRLVGDAATVPEEPPAPSPERETCCGLLEALSIKARFAVRVPEAVGLKRMVTVQLAEAASVEPQVC